MKLIAASTLSVRWNFTAPPGVTTIIVILIAGFLDSKKEPTLRQIYHYQFLGWEDQTSPSGKLLRFMDEINECYETKCPPDSGPILVHCS
jgi:protein tyrosine phosphatase